MTDYVDPADRLLEVIDTRAARAQAAKSSTLLLQWSHRNGKATLSAFLNDSTPADALRRYDADRQMIRLHSTNDAGECNVCCDGRKGFCSTMLLLFSAYGVKV